MECEEDIVDIYCIGDFTWSVLGRQLRVAAVSWLLDCVGSELAGCMRCWVASVFFWPLGCLSIESGGCMCCWSESFLTSTATFAAVTCCIARLTGHLQKK